LDLLPSARDRAGMLPAEAIRFLGLRTPSAKAELSSIVVTCTSSHHATKTLTNLCALSHSPISPYDNILALDQIETAYSTLLARPVASEWAKYQGRMSKIALDGQEHPRIITLGGDRESRAPLLGFLGADLFAFSVLLSPASTDTVLLPILRSLNKVYGEVSVIVCPHVASRDFFPADLSRLQHFDAHIDSWNGNTYVGASTEQSKITHGSFFWKAGEEGLISNTSSIHAGIRTRLSDEEDLAYDEQVGFKLLTTEDIDDLGAHGIANAIRDRVGDRPCYLSFE
jgi:agmatinase